LLVFLSANVLDLPVIKFLKQVDGLAEKRPDLLAFYLVFAIKLFDQ
jgi:hypothetical protein